MKALIKISSIMAAFALVMGVAVMPASAASVIGDDNLGDLFVLNELFAGDNLGVLDIPSLNEDVNNLS